MKTILVRYGEIALKGHAVRRRFEDKLVENISSALPFECDIRLERGRIFISTKRLEDALDGLVRVFGITSFSPCEVVESNLDTICEKALMVAGGHLIPGDTFALRVRRHGEHPFTSKDVAVRSGDEIRRLVDVEVDLSNPGKEIFIEIRERNTYVYTEIFEGLGGFPLGTQGAVAVLLSGGIDSPVAAFLAMRRGCKALPLHLDLHPFVEGRSKEHFIRLARKLREYSIGEEFIPTIFPYGSLWKEVVEEVPPKLRCILCKRGMLKIAYLFASRNGCDGIVTGESIGQVASQTLRNLGVTAHGLEKPVLRPLVTYDKNEIVEIARKISTYSLSVAGPFSCKLCPSRPSTSANLEEVLKVEERIGFNELLDDVYSRRERIEF